MFHIKLARDATSYIVFLWSWIGWIICSQFCKGKWSGRILRLLSVDSGVWILRIVLNGLGCGCWLHSFFNDSSCRRATRSQSLNLTDPLIHEVWAILQNSHIMEPLDFGLLRKYYDFVSMFMVTVTVKVTWLLAWTEPFSFYFLFLWSDHLWSLPIGNEVVMLYFLSLPLIHMLCLTGTTWWIWYWATKPL